MTRQEIIKQLEIIIGILVENCGGKVEILYKEIDIFQKQEKSVIKWNTKNKSLVLEVKKPQDLPQEDW